MIWLGLARGFGVEGFLDGFMFKMIMMMKMEGRWAILVWSVYVY